VALSRWRWIWGPALAIVLLAVLLLPGRGALASGGILQLLQGDREMSFPPGSFRNDVQGALRTQHARLRSLQRADSIVAALRGPRVLRGRAPNVALVYETPLTSADARAWLDAAEKELAQYRSPSPAGSPLVVALYSNPARARTPEFKNYFWRIRRRLSDSLQTTCTVEVNLVPWGRAPRRSQRAAKPLRAFLGLCGLARTFGPPGAQVARWMGVGTSFLGDFGDAPAWNTALAEAAVTVPRRQVERPEVTVGQAGWQWFWGTPWVPIGCLHGAPSLCERNAHLRGGAGVWWGYADPRTTQVVAHLLRTGTPAQFAAFWRSPLPVGDALERAYGRPAGQLAYEAFSHWYYAAPGGPRAEPRPLLAGLFWAVAALALALVAGRRRTTEI
jgi:hypothetical protein